MLPVGVLDVRTPSGSAREVFAGHGGEGMRKRLTMKQRLFVIEWLICANAAEAARRAKYSVHSARWIGYENLQSPYILKAISERLAELGAR